MDKYVWLFGIVMLSLVSVGFASEIDDLLDSYNFTYVNSEFEIEFLNMSLIDLNNNSKSDVIELNLNVNVVLEDEYLVIYQIKSNNGYEIAGFMPLNLSYGDNVFPLVFDVNFIEEGSYSLGIKVFRGNELMYQNFEFMELSIDESEYDLSPFTIESLDYVQESDNLKIDFIINNLPENVTLGKVILSNGSTLIQSVCNITSENVSFVISAEEIFRLRTELFEISKIYFFESENVIYGLEINSSVVLDLAKFSIENSHIQNAILELENENSNEIYESLNLVAQVYGNESQDYEVRAIVKDESGNTLKIVSKEEFLSSGLNEVVLKIEGDEIYNLAMSGPYSIRIVSLYQNSELVDKLENGYKSENVNYYDFKHDQADLNVTKIDYDNETGELYFIIENVGEADVYNFVLRVYDENLDMIDETIIDCIFEGEGKGFEYMLDENLSSVFVYVDFYDDIEEIDECNNFASWPEMNSSLCVEESSNESGEDIALNSLLNQGGSSKKNKDIEIDTVMNETNLSSISSVNFNEKNNELKDEIKSKKEVKSNEQEEIQKEDINLKNQKLMEIDKLNFNNDAELGLNIERKFKNSFVRIVLNIFSDFLKMFEKIYDILEFSN